MDKIYYKVVYLDNVKWKQQYFPQMKCKKFWSIMHTIKFWFRWNFNHKKWYPLILEKQPNWLK